MSLASFSAAASLILGFSSTAAASAGASPSAGASASAGGSASTGAAFFAAFFLGGAFLPFAGFPFPFAGAAFGFAPLAFSIYAFLTSSTDFPDLSSSITSYIIDSWTPSEIVVCPPCISSAPTNSFFFGLSAFALAAFFGAAFFLTGAFFFGTTFFFTGASASSTG